MTQNSDLDQARLLFKQSKRDEARNVLIKAVHTDPRDVDAWFGLSFCVDDPGQKRDCLERVLRLAPDHLKARVSLQKLLIGEENLPDIPPEIPPTVEPDLQDLQDGHAVIEHAENQNAPVKKTNDELIHSIEQMEQKGQPGKKAGESTYRTAKKWRTTLLIFGIVVEIVLLIIGTFLMLNKPTGHNSKLVLALFFGFIFVFICGMILIDKLGDRWDKFRRGAKAEELVGEILKNLPPDYVVLNDIQLGYGNIDHFVIGKNGSMYMIETKSHKGKVTVENEQIRINNKRTEKDFLKQCLRNAYDVRDEIASILGVNLTVTPVLVFTAAFVPYEAKIKNIIIMNKKTLLKFILSGKEQPNRAKIWEKRGIIQEFLYRPRW